MCIWKGSRGGGEGGREAAGSPSNRSTVCNPIHRRCLALLYQTRFIHGPSLVPFQQVPTGPALFVGKNEPPGAGMFPRRGVRRSVWTSGHLRRGLAAVACESRGPSGGLAAVCLGMCGSDHEISCQVICCEIHYEKHPETDAWLEILSWLNCRNYLPKILSAPYVRVIYLYARGYKMVFAVVPHAKRSLSKSVTETSILDYCTPRSAIISENTSLGSSQQSEVDELLKCNRKSTPHGSVKQWM